MAVAAYSNAHFGKLFTYFISFCVCLSTFCAAADEDCVDLSCILACVPSNNLKKNKL